MYEICANTVFKGKFMCAPSALVCAHLTICVRAHTRAQLSTGPTLWNSLPVELKTAYIPLETFKSKLKTYLFTIAYH